MPNPFVSDDEFVLIRAGHKFKKLIQREGRCKCIEGDVYPRKQSCRCGITLNVAWTRCGVGITLDQFKKIVRDALNQQWCFMHKGPRRGVRLIFNEAFKDVFVGELERLEEV